MNDHEKKSLPRYTKKTSAEAMVVSTLRSIVFSSVVIEKRCKGTSNNLNNNRKIDSLG